MGRHCAKKKPGGSSGASNPKPNKSDGQNIIPPKSHDKDVAVFVSAAHGLKDEGNKLFQKRCYEGAMLKYEKALKLLPRNHVDVSYLRSNMAACLMQLGVCEYPRAIHECNLALEVTPTYSKALLKRSRCYEGLDRPDLALRDANLVLDVEPNNLMALEMIEKVKSTTKKKGEKVIDVCSDPSSSSSPYEEVKVKRKKKSNKFGDKKEKTSNANGEQPKKMVKLVFGDDIRCAHLPINYSLLQLREAIRDRFPSSNTSVIKYQDQEGDLITITTDEELRWAESLTNPHGSFRLYIVETHPDHGLVHEIVKKSSEKSSALKHIKEGESNNVQNGVSYIDDWIIQFAKLFRDHAGIESDACLDLHKLGSKLCTDAMEETVTSDEAQGLLDMAAKKFQEMTALSLFDWGNVHLSRARKQVHFTSAYDWVLKEYSNAGRRYQEALETKPDFYEALLALSLQQFEQARLSWYHAIDMNADLETWAWTEVLPLYNSAEEHMERGARIWEELGKQQVNKLSMTSETERLRDTLTEEAVDQPANMMSLINLLWGTMLYERSIMEFKLDIPVWRECLEVAVENFELAGVSTTDIAVMLKNHCSNTNGVQGFGFKIDEMVQAWNEMNNVKRWHNVVSSLRLEPLFRRRVPRLHRTLENP